MTEPFEALGSPDESRGGPDVDAAVANAELGTQVEGVHTPSGEAESGDSRLEQMTEVDVSSDRDDADPAVTATRPKPGPSPDEVGSGGAQRVVGARISDRVSAGETVPDGRPFDSDRDDAPER